MKKSNKVLFATVSLVLSLFALNANAEPTKSEGRGKGQRAERSGEQMGAKLNLTDTQKTQMKALQTEQRVAMEAIRNDESLTQEQRREKARTSREGFEAQRKAILTPEQQAIAAAERANRTDKGEKGKKGERKGGEGKAKK
ncbi:MAG: hypothetical protein Q8M02_12765 [Candidatus Didemnitutus sp.]|nr:hypothetical protein [Candidatus Didemnitutus sp.]